MTSPPDPFVAIGALLTRAHDLDKAVDAMSRFVLDPNDQNRSALSGAGINANRAGDFLLLLPKDPAERGRQCQLARAWVIGRSSAQQPASWQPVVTTGEVEAAGVDRLTAETMIGLIVGARTTLRIFSPFIDARGIDVLTLPLVAATRRRVRVSIGYAVRGNRENAVQRLKLGVEESGAPDQFRAVAIESDRPFPHLKLIAADGNRAYIGSANLTWPALTSNAEVGALVDGASVHVLERWFDDLITPQPTVNEVSG